MRAETVRSLLVVNTEPGERRVLSAIAARAGWTVVGAASAENAADVLKGAHGRDVQSAILGNWDAEAGPQLIESLRKCREDLPIIVLAEPDQSSHGVSAMRAGATDFLGRPIAAERLLEALATHSDRRRLVGELAPIAEKLAPAMSLEQLVGSTPAFRSALAVAAKSARSRLPVLIVGEPGTGKESFARAIHAASPRAKGPLITMDCKAVPANAAASELFGHQRGAFPGAFADRDGLMLTADAGTLLLDDIDALPPETQEMLDRVLATGEVRPVGCYGSMSVDVRLIATSSAPLGEDFHAMLGERIGATVVALPALHDRSGDIPALARHLLTRFEQHGLMKPLSIGNDALAVLMRYGWPGNVRQLASVLFRAGLQSSSGSLTAEDFPHIAAQSRFSRRRSDVTPHLGKAKSEDAIAGAANVTLFDDEGHMRTLEDIEADIIRLAIGHYRGRMTEVAKRLGIGRSTLYRRLGELGIDTAA